MTSHPSRSSSKLRNKPYNCPPEILPMANVCTSTGAGTGTGTNSIIGGVEGGHLIVATTDEHYDIKFHTSKRSPVRAAPSPGEQRLPLRVGFLRGG